MPRPLRPARRRDLILALLLALAWRVWLPPSHDAAAPQLAFWGFLIAVASLIWSGVEAAAEWVLLALQWSVKVLWTVVVALKNTFVDLGQFVWGGVKKVWQFLRWIEETALMPAWQKFWSFVQQARDLLNRVFGPILDFLHTVRDTILSFYNQWIRPILDTIELGRKVLKVLEALHVGFAKKLDDELGSLEQKIDGLFRPILQKVNDAINVINRIVTADGLFQRLYLLKSIERDWAMIHNQFSNLKSNPLGFAEKETLHRNAGSKTVPEVQRDVHQYLESRGGADAALFDEAADQWRIYFRAA